MLTPVAGIKLQICLYLQNPVKLLNENTEHLFFVLSTDFRFSDFYCISENVPACLEMGFMHEMGEKGLKPIINYADNQKLCTVQ